MSAKNFAAVATLIAGLLALSGCGGSSGDGSDSGTTATAPTITSQPESVTVSAGSSASFSVTASGADTLSYQWYKDDVPIAAATASSYTQSDVTSDDAGSYYVIVANASGSTQSSTATLTVSTTSAACDATYVSNVISAINDYETALGSSLTASLLYASTSYTTSQLNQYKTQWSNLPGPTRPGLSLSQMTSEAQITAFNTLVSTALSAQGHEDFQGVIAADDYLGYTLNGNGYGADLYHVAVVGTPSESGLWSLMLGGHHLAFNLTFNGGCLYPTPHHIGVEPRTTFTANDHYASAKGTAVYGSGSYTVLANKGDAMFAIFSGMSSAQLSASYLSGQTFSDVLIGPVEYNTGSYSNAQAKFAAVEAGSTRGLLVSTLSSAQQSLVTAAISEYVGDYDDATKARLLADYQADYDSTYVAWANASGTSSATAPNVSTSGGYLRIDGPRVWIEIAIQNGVIVSNQTHYHMMYRDKSYDYYNELSG